MYDINFTDKFAVNYMIPLQLPLWLTESSSDNIDIDTVLSDVVLAAAKSVVKADEYYLLYVGAHWCAPCKGLRPVLINILDSYSEIPCYEIHLDESLSYQQSKLLRSLPALILYHANKPIQQINGLVSSDKIHQLLTFDKTCSSETRVETSAEIRAEEIAIDQLKQKIQNGSVDEALTFYNQLNHDIKYQSHLQQIKSLIDLILDSKKQLKKLSPKDDVYEVYNLFSQSLIAQGLDLLLQLAAQLPVPPSVKESINCQLYVKGINTLTDKQQAKYYRQQLSTSIKN